MSTGDPICPRCGGWAANCRHMEHPFVGMVSESFALLPTTTKPEDQAMTPLSPTLLSCHDHGNCELCDQIERSLAERDARIAEIEGRYKASHTIRAYLKAKLAAAEARNAELVKALEAEAPDHWPTDQQIGWDKCREHLRAALTEQPK